MANFGGNMTLNIEQRLGQKLTNEQQILWNSIFLRFGERCAISQYVYNGPVGAGEMLTYTAGRIYLAYQFSASRDNSTFALPVAAIFYDENNVAFSSYSGGVPYWDATGATVRFAALSIINNNFWFSRVLFSGYTYYNFIGYRIMY